MTYTADEVQDNLRVLAKYNIRAEDSFPIFSQDTIARPVSAYTQDFGLAQRTVNVDRVDPRTGELALSVIASRGPAQTYTASPAQLFELLRDTIPTVDKMDVMSAQAVVDVHRVLKEFSEDHPKLFADLVTSKPSAVSYAWPHLLSNMTRGNPPQVPGALLALDLPEAFEKAPGLAKMFAGSQAKLANGLHFATVVSLGAHADSLHAYQGRGYYRPAALTKVLSAICNTGPAAQVESKKDMALSIPTITKVVARVAESNQREVSLKDVETLTSAPGHSDNALLAMSQSTAAWKRAIANGVSPESVQEALTAPVPANPMPGMKQLSMSKLMPAETQAFLLEHLAAPKLDSNAFEQAPARKPGQALMLETMAYTPRRPGM